MGWPKMTSQIDLIRIGFRPCNQADWNSTQPMSHFLLCHSSSRFLNQTLLFCSSYLFLLFQEACALVLSLSILFLKFISIVPFSRSYFCLTQSFYIWKYFIYYKKEWCLILKLNRIFQISNQQIILSRTIEVKLN